MFTFLESQGNENIWDGDCVLTTQGLWVSVMTEPVRTHDGHVAWTSNHLCSLGPRRMCSCTAITWYIRETYLLLRGFGLDAYSLWQPHLEAKLNTPYEPVTTRWCLWKWYMFASPEKRKLSHQRGFWRLAGGKQHRSKESRLIQCKSIIFLRSRLGEFRNYSFLHQFQIRGEGFFLNSYVTES